MGIYCDDNCSKSAARDAICSGSVISEDIGSVDCDDVGSLVCDDLRSVDCVDIGSDALDINAR